jgi:hypothetical protein
MDENYGRDTSANADDELRQRARAAIRAGVLPGHRQVSTWGGPGSGASCAVCSTPVVQDGLGLELEFRDPDGRLELRYVHIPCFAAWDLERMHFLQAGSDGGTLTQRERAKPR